MDSIIIEKLNIILEEICAKLLRLRNPADEKEIREEYMIKRVSAVMKKNQKARFFGQFGYAHVYKLDEYITPFSDCIGRMIIGSNCLIKIMFIYKDAVYQKKEKNKWTKCRLNMFDIKNSVTKQLMENGDFPLNLLENNEYVERYVLKAYNKGFYIVM